MGHDVKQPLKLCYPKLQQGLQLHLHYQGLLAKECLGCSQHQWKSQQLTHWNGHAGWVALLSSCFALATIAAEWGPDGVCSVWHGSHLEDDPYLGGC